MKKLTWIPMILPLLVYAQEAWRDPSAHRVQFVEVQKDVTLEVLDWGGTGRALVLLPGLGNTAHVFDDFAPKLVPDYHVYGITRRGFGASSVPPTGYDAVRLGDDVLAILESLKIVNPVLVGHSVAGSELSSVGSRHPERVSGLVYLDAGYRYAFSEEPFRSRTRSETNQAGRGARQAQAPPGPTESDRDSFRSLLDYRRRTTGVAAPEAEYRQTYTFTSGSVLTQRTTPADAAIRAGTQQWTHIPVPALAIFAVPKDRRTDEEEIKQAEAFEKGVPSARVVRLPHANHYVFLSNESDVLREMHTFLLGLR